MCKEGVLHEVVTWYWNFVNDNPKMAVPKKLSEAFLDLSASE